MHETILVVDDDREIVGAIAILLEKEGYRVIRAYNGMEALDRVMDPAVQLLLIYFGGSIFRTAGLTEKELQTVLWLSFLVVPADLLRKIFLRLAHKKGDL